MKPTINTQITISLPYELAKKENEIKSTFANDKNVEIGVKGLTPPQSGGIGIGDIVIWLGGIALEEIVVGIGKSLLKKLKWLVKKFEQSYTTQIHLKYEGKLIVFHLNGIPEEDIEHAIDDIGNAINRYKNIIILPQKVAYWINFIFDPLHKNWYVDFDSSDIEFPMG